MSTVKITKLPGWKQLECLGREARIKAYRLQMREGALRFREEIAPDGCFSSFTERCEQAVNYIESAIFYRNLARTSADFLSEFRKRAL